MEFKTTVNEVKKALQVLSPIVNHANSTLTYRYILLEKKEDRARFVAFNTSVIGDSFADCYDWEGEEERVYILAKHVFSLINSFNAGEIIFKITPEKCTIKSGRSKYSLLVLDKKVIEEPLLIINNKDYGKNLGVNVKIDKFSMAYSSVCHCLSKDDSQPTLQNIFLKDGKMIACDGVRGAVVDFDTESINDVSLHKKACDCILNIKNSKDISLFYSDGYVYGHTPYFNFITTVSEDEYPYEQINTIIEKGFGKEYPYLIKIDPEEIIDKLGRVLMFADEETNSIKVGADKNVVSLVVENKNFAEEEVGTTNNITNKFSLFIDGKNFKECFSKSLSNSVNWYSFGEDDIQYVNDGSLLQFFLGLNK
jgi:DNA polymerase III sliding clamp (beta) subunit (PCNA family)